MICALGVTVTTVQMIEMLPRRQILRRFPDLCGPDPNWDPHLVDSGVPKSYGKRDVQYAK